MGLDPNVHVQIAADGSCRARLAFIANPHDLAFLKPRWNMHRENSFFLLSTRAQACAASFFDDMPLALACGASHHPHRHAEEPGHLLLNSPITSTGGAFIRTGSRPGAAAATGFTEVHSFELKCFV